MQRYSSLLTLLWADQRGQLYRQSSTFYDYIWLKRLFDVVMSAFLLIFLSPWLLFISLLIYLDSPGPVLFRQIRVGKHGQLFVLWKFRSMHLDAEQQKATLLINNDMPDGILFKIKLDPRITRAGRLLRKFSLDELPQLWNVLKGDMSLVGPRPPLPEEVQQYTPYQRQRLEVIPGITGLWQISGRSEIPFLQQVELDLQYIATQSLGSDLKILLKTVPAVLTGRGAY